MMDDDGNTSIMESIKSPIRVREDYWKFGALNRSSINIPKSKALALSYVLWDKALPHLRGAECHFELLWMWIAEDS